VITIAVILGVVLTVIMIAALNYCVILQKKATTRKSYEYRGYYSTTTAINII
jgi:hypothetical protein